MSKQQKVDWPKLRLRLARYLPTTLFNSLRDLPDDLDEIDPSNLSEASGVLLDATRALNPLHRVLVQYMPRYLLELDPTPNQSHGEILEGSFIFADVSGFTALTELLSRFGDAKGREVMNQIMNRLFSSVLDPITASGGDMLIFVGDAALVFFPKEELNNDVLQAVRAGLRMQRAIEPFKSVETEFGTCSLAMSIGIEQGKAYAGVVGTKDRMELLVSGPGTFGAMHAEVIANAGQIVLGEKALVVAEDHFTMDGALVVDDLGDNLDDYEITSPTRRRGSSIAFGMGLDELLDSLETNLERVERLAPFVPEDMLALLVNTDQRRKLQAEFRPVAIQFINVLGVEDLAMNYGPELATQVFQQYFNNAKHIIQQHEGIISQIDAYITGFFFLNTFGVPKSHEGTTRYAVSAALQLEQALERINQQFNLDPPLEQRGGITYGLTFNGEIGANYRRESVIAGPAVNRAARLMSKAEPGQVILDFDIWEQTQNAFVGEELPAVTLKGIDRPVAIINVHQIRRGTRLPPLERPILERENEQTQFTEALQALQTSQQSSAWMICGETGIGKTTLMSKLAETVNSQEVTLLAGYCQPHTKYAPLSCWLDMVVGWLDFQPDDDLVEQSQHLSSKLATVGLSALENDLAEFLSLPENEFIEESGTFRAKESRTTGANSSLPEDEFIEQEPSLIGPNLIIELVRRLAQRQPLLIILEDVHWIDNESLRLLELLLDNIDELSLMLVITGHKPISDENEKIKLLSLSVLSKSAIIEVAQRALGADSLDDNLTDWLHKQAGGNSLYAKELCYALYRSDAIIVDKSVGEARWTGSIPSLPLTLHELLLSRLDKLPLAQQEVMKRCAALGGEFDDRTILKLSQPQLEKTEVENALNQAIQAEFLTAVGRSMYRFTHPLMQEAIYNTLSFSQRHAWHDKIGNWLSSDKEQEEKNLEQIVYHYMRSTNVKQAALYGIMAGDKAREREAYTGALDYYQQVYGLTDAPIRQRMLAVENQADVLALQGAYQKAVMFYPQATKLGSKTAASKQAIFTGDITMLTDTKFTPQLQPWADGARVCLLAQDGQTEVALELARTALEQAEGATHTALTVLVQNLENNRLLDSYDVWLQKFVTAVLQLGMSTIDLLDMPASHSKIINKLARKHQMSLSDVAEALKQLPAEIQPILDELVEKGHIKQTTIRNEVLYKARFARKAKKKLSADVWSALDF
jgi:class 3 adenylate cyclase/tetratricopeptide (TPR) repeat protein